MSNKPACLLVLALLVGCKSAAPQPPLASQPSTSPPHLSAAEGNELTAPTFSLRRVMELVGFSRPAASSPNALPAEVAQLGDVVNSVFAKASALSVNDPPHVTAQKAQGILESLSQWDGLLSGVQSLGLVSNETAGPLRLLGGQLRDQTQSLLQFGGNPETITAIQQLAGQLKAAFGGVTALASGGSAAYNAFLGHSPQ